MRLEDYRRFRVKEFRSQFLSLGGQWRICIVVERLFRVGV